METIPNEIADGRPENSKEQIRGIKGKPYNAIWTDDFDRNSMDNMGRCFYWRLDVHAKAIIQLIRADEIKLALKLLDMLPAWQRENYPEELAEIRKVLYQQTYDVQEYSSDPEEAGCEREFGETQFDNSYMYPRANIISQMLLEFNTQNITPWIFDLGCSHGNLPLGLIKHNFKFNYFGKAMNYRIQEKVKNWVGPEIWADRPGSNQKTILWCTEVLEHSWDEEEVVHSAYKVGVDFDQIILSVPYACLGGGLPDWDTRRVGHVRAYSKKDFHALAIKHWPGFEWKMVFSPSMVLIGKKDNK